MAWVYEGPAGYKFLLISHWKRRGRDCLLPSRLKLSGKIPHDKTWAKTWDMAMFASQALFPLWCEALNSWSWDVGKDGGGLRPR